MSEITQEWVLKRLERLEEERAQQLADLNATLGKIAEMNGWLNWLNEQSEKSPDELPAPGEPPASPEYVEELVTDPQAHD